MTLRKIATLLLGAGLTFGILGAGISASLQQLAERDREYPGRHPRLHHRQRRPPGVIAADGQSVTYDAGKILRSAASSAPFSFVVKATGDVPVNLHLTQTAPRAPFTSILGSRADVTLAPDATHDDDAGLQWTELGSSDMGELASITYTVACGEDRRVRYWSAGTPATTERSSRMSTTAAGQAAGWAYASVDACRPRSGGSLPRLQRSQMPRVLLQRLRARSNTRDC